MYITLDSPGMNTILETQNVSSFIDCFKEFLTSHKLLLRNCDGFESRNYSFKTILFLKCQRTEGVTVRSLTLHSKLVEMDQITCLVPKKCVIGSDSPNHLKGRRGLDTTPVGLDRNASRRRMKL